MDRHSLAIRIARTPSLGMMPTVTIQILKLADNPRVSAKQLASVMEREPNLAAKLLRAANSTYYGTGAKVNTLSQAITMLGINTARSLAVAQAYQQATSGKPGASLFDRNVFWQHCLATATAARVLARLKRLHDPELAFIAGMLHDSGRMALDRFMPFELDRAIQLSIETNIPLIEAEQEVMQFDHSDVGVMLAEQWGLPDQLKEAIEFHHQEVAYEENPLACLIRAGNVIAHQLGFALGMPNAYGEDDPIFEALELPSEQIEPLARAVETDVLRTMDLYAAA